MEKMDKLKKPEYDSEKCSCTPCSYCKGTGDVYYSVQGDFLGRGRIDDLDELEPCPYCGGEGYISKCSYCREYEEMVDEYYWLLESEGE